MLNKSFRFMILKSIFLEFKDAKSTKSDVNHKNGTGSCRYFRRIFHWHETKKKQLNEYVHFQAQISAFYTAVFKDKETDHTSRPTSFHKFQTFNLETQCDRIRTFLFEILETEVFKMTGGEKSLDDCICEICIGRLNLSFLWLIIISFQMTSQPSQFNIIL